MGIDKFMDLLKFITYSFSSQTVFSRVAQVCKRDQGGGQFLLTNTWTSFLKARLKCAVPGDFSFFFDEIRKFFNSLLHFMCFLFALY